MELGNCLRVERRAVHFATIRLHLRAVRRRGKSLAQRNLSSGVYGGVGVLHDGIFPSQAELHFAAA